MKGEIKKKKKREGSYQLLYILQGRVGSGLVERSRSHWEKTNLTCKSKEPKWII